MTDRSEIEAVVEAALFATPEPIKRSKLVNLFSGEDRKEVPAAIDAVLERYAAAEHRGIAAEEVAGGLRLVTRPELHGYLRRLFDLSGKSRLSMAALETLAIVAYRQPMTGPEIQELRGVNSSGVLKTLLERRLVRITGRKMVVGKPFLYGTTRDFLMHFGLQNLDDLPPLEEFEELMGQLGLVDDGEVVAAGEVAEVIGPEPVALPEEVASVEESGEEE